MAKPRLASKTKCCSHLTVMYNQCNIVSGVKSIIINPQRCVSIFKTDFYYLNLESLENSRNGLDLYFTYKLLNGYIDCPNFFARLSLVSSTSTRSTNLFFIKSQTTNLLCFKHTTVKNHAHCK